MRVTCTVQYVVQGVAWRVQTAVDPSESEACAIVLLPDPVKAPFSSPLQAVTDFTSRHRNFYSGAARSAFLSRFRRVDEPRAVRHQQTDIRLRVLTQSQVRNDYRAYIAHERNLSTV